MKNIYGADHYHMCSARMTEGSPVLPVNSSRLDAKIKVKAASVTLPRICKKPRWPSVSPSAHPALPMFLNWLDAVSRLNSVYIHFLIWRAGPMIMGLIPAGATHATNKHMQPWYCSASRCGWKPSTKCCAQRSIGFAGKTAALATLFEA